MSGTPAWKKAEREFEKSFEPYGKKAAVFRLTDTAAAKAVAGKRAFVAAQPSDYMVVLDGQVFFAEVKSTSDNTSFHFSNIRKAQIAASRRIVKAGAGYFFFIKSLVLNQWFCVPAAVIHNTIASGTKHLKWQQIQDYAYEI